MQNIGEEIVGEYLRIFLKCDFISYNVYHPKVQGEIDVIGIQAKAKKLYICEVATHLITGLQYVKERQPDNVDRFVNKFEKNIEYAKEYFKEYDIEFMLWSPIVKNQGDSAKYSQMKDIEEIKKKLNKEYKVDLKVIINTEYLDCLNKLKQYASEQTKELKSPVLRLFQIEEKLKSHIEKLDKKTSKSR